MIFEVRTLPNFEKEAKRVALIHLEEQVMKGNTFFLNIEELSKVDTLKGLVPLILLVRQKQILNLSETPTLGEVYSTYYGFQVVTKGSVEYSLPGVSDQAQQQLVKLMSDFGKSLRLSHRQVRLTRNAFGRVSEYTRQLLWNLLITCAGGKKSEADAIRELGEFRDSRSTEILHLKLKSSSEERIQRRIIQALGAIGHPASLPVLNEFLHPPLISLTERAIGSITPKYLI